MHKVVAAYDPGPHCGVAVFMDGKVVVTTTIADTDGQLSQYLHLARDLANLWRPADEVTVVIEDYRSHLPLTPDGADTLKLAGWIAGNAMQHGYRVVWQMPVQRTPFVERARDVVKAAPDQNTGILRHRVDATAHALAYLRKTGGLDG